mmetsp:Transcript_138174/g.358971  ORF Transcript_138174/g.358971 Transcript_138174/m.358971 type:complete len:86 (+) Transcript_138174:986-1243(+)
MTERNAVEELMLVGSAPEIGCVDQCRHPALSTMCFRCHSVRSACGSHWLRPPCCFFQAEAANERGSGSLLSAPVSAMITRASEQR